MLIKPNAASNFKIYTQARPWPCGLVEKLGIKGRKEL
tara:strand:+ start:1304 stop:1414 length:111 start_codon:yes stop_codon:yes gene_type:complete